MTLVTPGITVVRCLTPPRIRKWPQCSSACESVSWNRRSTPSSTPPSAAAPRAAEHLRTGLEGERAAFFWLMRRGYVIVARAWHSSRAPGDLDLIAWSPSSQGDTLCFIEVKTRTTREVAPAHLAVDSSKRRVLRRLARHYMRQLPTGTSTPVSTSSPSTSSATSRPSLSTSPAPSAGPKSSAD